MKAAEIREAFLSYYEGKGHTRLASASLVPSSYDPSVLLTTAGMQPFKPYFLAQEQPPAPRVTSCQKCFRTPDIDSVGLTARHLTSFEMLGNFSFGDYFKEGAVEMAWDLCTNVLGLPAELLWVTVHEGDEALGLGPDEETRALWRAQGVPDERIVLLGEDNFWKAGPTGPCGPCTEIYYDRGEAFGCGAADCAPGCECDRYLEFYNLVFMAFDRDEKGVLSPLPSQNIDTGMGLERIAAIMQGNVTVFDVDNMRRLIDWGVARSGRSYDDGDAAAVKALRVLADHGRGMAFLASDGVMPSNEGRGYVLRRIIRRAIQHASRIGLYDDGASGVLRDLHAQVIATWGDVYSELNAQAAIVADILDAEEQRFLRTLAKGSALLEEQFATVGAGGTLSGDAAFQLHDTYGFPVELTEELAAEQGITVDHARFTDLMKEQRERARAAAGGGELPVEAAAAFVRSAPATVFVGYTEMSVAATVTAVEQLAAGDGTDNRVLIKLDRSPFYAEGGGQVADAGTITGERGRAQVEHVMRYDSDQVIVAHVDGTLAVGDAVQAEVDAALRLATESNHTATHLLHWALRRTLGDHVRQAGSLVAPDRLRFDFSHTSAIGGDDLDTIEHAVNERIAEAAEVRWSEMSIDQAREAGAMMLFGEKYGDTVRMVEVGDGFSRELCGGTHVANTGQIRACIITAEASVGANTRRVEALTGDAALRYLRERAAAAEAAARSLNVDVQTLPERVTALKHSVRELEKELSSVRTGSGVDDAVAAAIDVDGVSIVAFNAGDLTGDQLLELSDHVKGKLGVSAVVLASAHGGKVALVANVDPRAVERGISAGDLISSIAPIVGGGGGGRPTLARAGGKDATRIDEALEHALVCARDALNAPVGS